jgi:nitrate/TMAO reductase-like tetraheme cytochrome c subunit
MLEYYSGVIIMEIAILAIVIANLIVSLVQVWLITKSSIRRLNTNEFKESIQKANKVLNKIKETLDKNSSLNNGIDFDAAFKHIESILNENKSNPGRNNSNSN